MASPDLPQDIFHRNLDILIDDSTGGTAVDSHLFLFLIHGNPVPLIFHYKACELGSVNLGICKKKIGKTGIGDKLLLSVQDVIFAVFG
jgi:hypothetical protein